MGMGENKLKICSGLLAIFAFAWFGGALDATIDILGWLVVFLLAGTVIDELWKRMKPKKKVDKSD